MITDKTLIEQRLDALMGAFRASDEINKRMHKKIHRLIHQASPPITRVPFDAVKCEFCPEAIPT